VKDNNSQNTTGGRRTLNSIRAGQESDLIELSRVGSTDPTKRRFEGRVAATRSRAATSLLSQELEVETPAFNLQNKNNQKTANKNNKNMPDEVNRVRHRMPKPGEKNAPVFDVDKPEELGRFFDRIEDWFNEDEIESELEKKRLIVKYLDADSEIQWKALSKFETGTFTEFKAQVMASYPAAEGVMKGSVAALKRKIKKIGPVPTDDRDELLTLIRVMKAEIMKLKKITPPIHTNRELVELFLTRLSPEFASRVASKLSIHRITGRNNPAVQEDALRNPEDMYDIEEVMEMAKETSLEQANPFGKFLLSGSVSSGSSVKLEEAVARLTDSINLQNKFQTQYNEQVERKLSSLQSLMNSTSHHGFGGSQSVNYNRGPPTTGVQNQQIRCFYCNGLHKIPDCDDVRKHLDLGWIKRIEGYLRLPDGGRIPRDPSKTTRDIIEGMHKPRPGLIPMSKIGDKTALYQEQGNAMSYAQFETKREQSSSEMNEILGMIHRLGVSDVQKCLASQLQAKEEEDEEYVGNFD
jgi:hypothetical protein